ncbi:FdhF/YdeP family oxidoreductase [Propioniciclava coleopterorum]|uniref:FdhF/YdeP family oxidoreductase n=1 Tax=Propioniciclava coleopterorum TaxID=2714937 RepID=A0A6G7Y3C9_9ACTN|nr:FdhF/YdeP family oxidoreductase [Propioniciclava coleopterorum]QIK71131.1 FdhF/YdeP family oxidoreductase [Propioniciclava coleopterorum]
MARPAPDADPGDARLEIVEPSRAAAGVPAVLRALRMATEQMGVPRAALTLTAVNQKSGFDCPGCAWPDPDHRHAAEFCENGAKAVAEEATLRRVTPAFFAEHPVADLAERSDHWLGQQGRLTHPMLLPEGGTHYEPIGWDEAFDLIAAELAACDSPDEATFYTSGRTSNEAAYAYQLFVRQWGTNNLPDCSNLCHESSGVALTQTLGIGKGTVTLTDVETSDLVIVAGQNPGTNHPRMLSALERTKRNGGRIIALNPLLEPSLTRFKNPQTARGVLGPGTDLSDDYVQVRLNGDLAFFAGLNRILIERGALDEPFIADHTRGFDAVAAHLAGLDWATIEAHAGVDRATIERVADQVVAADSVIVCWAMGLTQHRNAVPTIREIVNFLLLRGNVGRPGAGACPVRGHSNVQGDRTVGINERPPAAFLDALERHHGVRMPREDGHDVVAAIRAMDAGRTRVFLGLGGNFVRATPDTARTERALRRTALSVHVSTKLNGSHAVTGRRALILPTLGRTERDETGGREQFVTVEDSMGMVHASRGRLAPASDQLRSEVAIVTGLAERVFGRSPIDWAALGEDYARLRDAIEAVVPGFDRYDERVRLPGGFALPNGPRDARRFDTGSGRAEFTVNPLTAVEVPEGRLLLQTVRSHDQFNTTVYGMDDVYRGVKDGRRVLFVNEGDRRALGFANGDLVDVVSEWRTDAGVEERRAPAFRLVDHATAPGCAAAYFPETNVLVPLDSTAEESGTPTSKSIVVRLEPAADPRAVPVK